MTIGPLRWQSRKDVLFSKEIEMSKVAIAASPISRMELPIFFVVVGVIISGALALVAATGDENFALIGVVWGVQIPVPVCVEWGTMRLADAFGCSARS